MDLLLNWARSVHSSRAHWLTFALFAILPHLVVRKYSSFTKCNKCYLAKEEKAKRRSVEERQRIDDAHKVHIEHMLAQRRVYDAHRRAAIDEPDRYLSIIIDGADQKHYQLPHFPAKSKNDAKSWKIQYHLVGALVHGKRINLYFFKENWSKDPNMTIEVLQHTLCTLPTIPRKLYLQLDNCSRENKNRYVLAYLALLVHRKVFQEVEISFLPVGHTHEDIDQIFSCLSKYVRKNKIECEEHLTRVKNGHRTPEPFVYLLDKVANFKTFANSYLLSFSGHSQPHAFRITRNDATEEIGLWTKAYMSSTTWIGESASIPFTFIRFPSDISPKALLHSMPAAKAKELPDTVIRAMKRMVPVMERQFESINVRNSLLGVISHLETAHSTPIEFHWPNGGLFAQELVEESEESNAGSSSSQPQIDIADYIGDILPEDERLLQRKRKRPKRTAGRRLPTVNETTAAEVVVPDAEPTRRTRRNRANRRTPVHTTTDDEGSPVLFSSSDSDTDDSFDSLCDFNTNSAQQSTSSDNCYDVAVVLNNS